MDYLILGEIKGKIDLILSAVEQQKKDHDKIETRVGRIEKRINVAAGVFTSIVFMITFTSDFILTKLGIK